MRISFLLLFSFFMAVAVSAQSPIGVWKTIDDETGRAKSHLEVFEKNGKLHAKVVKLLERSETSLCDQCPGERKNKPLIGMVILENMAKSGAEWSGGQILDPNNGKWYTCKFWFEKGQPDVLQVRGYIAVFFRTQQWYRVK